VADEIMRALRQTGTAGRTRTELRDLFGRHRNAEDIGRALAALAAAGKAQRITRADTGGRAGRSVDRGRGVRWAAISTCLATRTTRSPRTATEATKATKATRWLRAALTLAY
jgi:hypothetical protein